MECLNKISRIATPVFLSSMLLLPAPIDPIINSNFLTASLGLRKTTLAFPPRFAVFLLRPEPLIPFNLFLL